VLFDSAATEEKREGGVSTDEAARCSWQQQRPAFTSWQRPKRRTGSVAMRYDVGVSAPAVASERAGRHAASYFAASAA